jgi:DNA replication protein
MDKFAKVLLQTGQTNISNYLLKNYHRLGMSSDQFIVYLQVKRNIDVNNFFPDISEITNTTCFSTQHAYQILHELIQKKLMRIKTVTGKNGHTYDMYDFSLMYEKLAKLTERNPTSNNTAINSHDNEVNNITPATRKEVFAQIEAEFGRPLSPMEIEMINQWIDKDKYNPKMINLALREAVLNQVYSLKYIDRILINWEKTHIKSPSDVEQARKTRQNNYTGKSKKANPDTKDVPDIPIFKLD